MGDKGRHVTWLREHPAQSRQWETAWGSEEQEGGNQGPSARTQRDKQQKLTLVKFKPSGKLLEGY